MVTHTSATLDTPDQGGKSELHWLLMCNLVIMALPQPNRKAIWAQGRNCRLLTSSWCDYVLLLLRQVSDSSTRLQQVELRRLKGTKPDISHKERCVTYISPYIQPTRLVSSQTVGMSKWIQCVRFFKVGKYREVLIRTDSNKLHYSHMQESLRMPRSTSERVFTRPHV